MSFVETEAALGFFVLFGLWDGGDIFSLAALADDALGRLPLLVELPMTARVGVGRIKEGCSKNGLFKLSCL